MTIHFDACSVPCERCEAVAWEVIGDFVPKRGRPQDVLACAFCGYRLRVDKAAWKMKAATDAATGHRRTEVFRFQYGRFAGKTIAEADAEPNGRRYLEVLRDTNEKLRPRIEEYFALDKAM